MDPQSVMEEDLIPNDKFKFLDNPIFWKGHEEYYRYTILKKIIVSTKSYFRYTRSPSILEKH